MNTKEEDSLIFEKYINENTDRAVWDYTRRLMNIFGKDQMGTEDQLVQLLQQVINDGIGEQVLQSVMSPDAPAPSGASLERAQRHIHSVYQKLTA